MVFYLHTSTISESVASSVYGKAFKASNNLLWALFRFVTEIHFESACLLRFDVKLLFGLERGSIQSNSMTCYRHFLHARFWPMVG